MADEAREAAADAKAAKARAKALRPWYRKKRFWTLGAVALIVIIAVASSSGSKSNSGGSSVAASSGSSSQDTTATTAVPAPTTTAAPTVLLATSGQGTKTSAPFAVSGSFNLTYSFDCAAFGGQGNFQVYVEDPDGTPEATPVNALAPSGSDTTYVAIPGGTYVLEMNSECSWSVKAVG